jgi:glycosyltransferase involved in cell wall biosynthesis
VRSSSTIKLSVCIPTHQGRVGELRTAIASVVDQLPASLADQVEICVSDNASSDGTEELVARLAAAAPIAILYRRSERDLGFGPNALRSVELANGKWCWLLGSDDVVAPGGIARAIALLDANPAAAGATVGRTAYDAELREALPEPHPWILPAPSEGAEPLRSTSEVFARVGLMIGFMSSQIVDHELWARAVQRLGQERLRQSRSVMHVALIGAMLAERPDWIWCSEPLVRQRTANAALDLHRGSLCRYMVNVSADLARVWRDVPGLDARTRRGLLERWRREVARPPMIAQIRSSPGHGVGDEIRLLIGFTRTFGRLRGFWSETAPALLRTSRDASG